MKHTFLFFFFWLDFLKHDIHKTIVFYFNPPLYHLPFNGFNYRKPLLSEFLNHNSNCDQIFNYGECSNRYVIIYIAEYVC